MCSELRKTGDNIFPKPLQAALGISVVIRTHNSSATLGLVLARLQLKAADDLIIVDSGSIDSTLALAKTYGARIIRTEPPFNYSASLNRGFEAAINEWVLVLSSHTIPTSDDFLTNIRRFTGSAPEDVVVGFGARVFKESQALSTSTGPWYERMPKTNFVWGAGNTLAVYRRRAWEIRGFRPDLRTAEDLEWFIWATSSGFSGATMRGVAGIYRNQGSCAHMFRKGWLEERQARLLMPQRRLSFCRGLVNLAIGMAYFSKLWVIGDLSFCAMARQQSHHVGACLAALRFSSKPARLSAVSNV